MKYTTDAYLITCITNLHAGSGDANFGVVDNLVQRDEITGFPVINSSSLKGALRQHFKDKGNKDSLIDYIFGPDAGRGSDKTKSNIGHYRFFPADLLSYPVRDSSGSTPFKRAVADCLTNTIQDKANALMGKNITNIGLYYGGDRIDKSDEELKKILRKLPVIARNQLDNGESKNLWYEEVVPRESRFVFFISYPKGDTNYDNFLKGLEKQVIQIGANASIGYGATTIKKINS